MKLAHFFLLTVLAAMLAGALSIAAPTHAAPAEASADDVQVTVVDRPRTDATNAHYVSNRAPLTPSPLIKLPLGSIKPQGWLRTQLELMADGLTGRLPELSKWVQYDASAWVDPDGRGQYPWEEVPYWLKGYGNLGHLLGNQRIIDEYTKWVEGIIQTRTEDGYFGPRVNVEEKPEGGYGPITGEKELDLWPNMIALDVLISHYEATGDERVIDLLRNYFKWQLTLPADDILPGYWDAMRGGDNLNAILWLYNHTGEAFLLDAAEKIHNSTARWDEEVVNWHGVNIAQGFREPAIWWQVSHKPEHHAAAWRNWETVIDQYGQVPGGLFGADENAREGYDDPRQAAETCTMVEAMHSFQMLGKIDGDPTWADLCEEIAFNDFPASHTPDLKALHYLTAPNQPMLDRRNKSPGIQNGGDMFSYDPRRYRCCQHNASHGWPYFAENLWFATADNGLAAFMYAPSTVTAKVGQSGTQVTIDAQTNYPFEGTVNLKLSTPEAVRFPLLLRIPEWAQGATIEINGQTQEIETRPSSYVSIERTWSDGDTVTLTLPQEIEVKRWEKNHNSASVRRGPLWYSLEIGQEKKPYWSEGGWEAYELIPTTPWNYGLILDESRNDGGVELMQDVDGELAGQPFTPQTNPLRLKAQGRRIPNWTLQRGNLVRELVDSPVRSSEETEQITLVPMGATRLRISQFPVIGEGESAAEWPAPPPQSPHYASRESGDIAAISDNKLPESSDDHSIPRFTWWPRRGTSEWIVYDLRKPKKVEEASVYWFDDTGRGSCRVPESWTLEYEDENGNWKPVPNASDFGIQKDQFNHVTFDPVMAQKLRINVQLRPEMSGGLLEVQVGPRPATTEPQDEAEARAARDQDQQPNVLMIISDDQFWFDLGFAGNKVIDTPHLDRLREQGVWLQRTFTPVPMCSPTRQAIYTGLYPVRSGAYPNHTFIQPGVRTMPQMMQDLGYRTALAGKTHYHPEESFPFEYIDFKPIEGADGPLRVDFDYDTIEQFITRDSDQPFLLVACSNEPHSPWNQEPAENYQSPAPEAIDVPPFLVDTPATRGSLTRYYDEIAFMDRQVGRLLAMLEEKGLAENTLVLFTTEQGAAFPSGKWTLYDAGIRTTTLARWPGTIDPGGESQAMISYVDVLPTLIDAASGQANGDLDGRSFLPVLRGEAETHRDQIFALQTSRGIYYGPEAFPVRTVRTPTHKLIWNIAPQNRFTNMVTERNVGSFWNSWEKAAETDPRAAWLTSRYMSRPEFELYDLQNDPWELDNLAGRPETAALQQQLLDELKQWMASQGDEGLATEMAAGEHQVRDVTQRTYELRHPREADEPMSRPAEAQ